ncbi:S8/S53 family peptidase [Granulosicoccus sp. 3-233]|uniref:S8/S53 family peptidase n=1 Tax=Granulosicoccus sp. 3-233 TaxID=3417969 RepID=UPI003D3545CD
MSAVVCKPLLAAALLLQAGNLQAADPPLPPAPSAEVGTVPTMRVALVDSGVDYRLAYINERLARQADGTLIGYDFWDLDTLPFDAHPDARGHVQRHGTATASVLLREAPQVSLVPYRYPRPDMQRMQALVRHAAGNEVRIIGLPLGGNKREEWLAFEESARAHPEILFVASAGNNGRNIDQVPVYPAALELPNLLVVTSADDFAMPAQGVNWGRGSVDYMVPAEHVPVIHHGGQAGHAAGSSYAVPRVMALAARWLQANPHWTVEQLLAAMRSRFANGAFARQLGQGYLHDPLFDPGQTIQVVSTGNWTSGSSSEGAARVVPLDVLLLDERWSLQQVSEVLDEAQSILDQCDVRFIDVQLRRVDAPDYLRDLETGSAKTLFEAVRKSGPQRRVTAVFARDSRMRQTFDAEAFGQGNTRTRGWLSDTVWLTLALQDRGIALAHELFHVLANSGDHSTVDGNLMLRRTTGSNRQLSPAQCDQLDGLAPSTSGQETGER